MVQDQSEITPNFRLSWGLNALAFLNLILVCQVPQTHVSPYLVSSVSMLYVLFSSSKSKRSGQEESIIWNESFSQCKRKEMQDWEDKMRSAEIQTGLAFNQELRFTHTNHLPTMLWNRSCTQSNRIDLAQFGSCVLLEIRRPSNICETLREHQTDYASAK